MPVDDRGLPEMLWHAVGSLAAYDRFTEVVTLVRNVLRARPRRRLGAGGGRTR